MSHSYIKIKGIGFWIHSCGTKTVVIPSKIIVPFAAFTTDDMVRIIREDI
jgi:hypothetical protein